MLLGLGRRKVCERLLGSARWMATKRQASTTDRPLPPPKRRVQTTVKEPEAGSTDLGQGAFVDFQPHLFPAAEAATLMQQLEEQVRWEQREVVVMGRRVMQPRLIAYMADSPSLQYTYSRVTLQPEPWSDAVLRIKAAVERAASATFNSCLMNYYRSGSDHISWHSDNEPLYGDEPCIASISFGIPREFILRSNAQPADKYRFWLGTGSLLVMRGTVQQHWMHCIPKRKGLEGARVNLTFRQIIRPEGTKKASKSGG